MDQSTHQVLTDLPLQQLVARVRRAGEASLQQKVTEPLPFNLASARGVFSRDESGRAVLRRVGTTVL